MLWDSAAGGPMWYSDGVDFEPFSQKRPHRGKISVQLLGDSACGKPDDLFRQWMRPAERIIVLDLKIAVGVLVEVDEKLVGSILALRRQVGFLHVQGGNQAGAAWGL
jgi:hypothetical protein